MGAALDRIVQQEILSHAVDLLRLDAGTRLQVLQLLASLEGDLLRQLLTGNLTDYNRARLQALFTQANGIIGDYYARISGVTDRAMSVAGTTAASTMVNALQGGVSVGLDMPTPTFLERLSKNVLIDGAPSGKWWSNMAADTQFRFASAVRQGMAQNETTEQIVSRVRANAKLGDVPGLMNRSRRNAEALVRTSIASAAADARREALQRNSDVLDGIRQVSTLDERTTDICIAYDGAEWDLNYDPIPPSTLPYGGGVPRHWNCRSVEVGITKSYAELGRPDLEEAPEGERAAQGGSVPAGTTFGDWLATRTEEQQNAQLGVGRAELWRQGKITLTQLLDLKGNPLTTAQLEAKYG